MKRLRRLTHYWPVAAVLTLVAHGLLQAFLIARPGPPAPAVWRLAPTALFTLTVLTAAAAAHNVLHEGWRRLFRGTTVFPIGAIIASTLLALLTYRAYPSSHDGQPPAWCLALPLEGDIAVLQGGPSADGNNHVGSPALRYAYDLAVVQDRSLHRGDGRMVADYYAYDQIVNAPIGGTVVAVHDGAPDRPAAGYIWDRWLRGPGNHIVLRVDEARFLVLAHLQAGSILVRTGDQVLATTPLARVGNSGPPGMPHLQLHVQDDPTPGRGEGVPVQFCAYEVVDWGEPWDTAQPVSRGEPTGRDRRQVIRRTATAP